MTVKEEVIEYFGIELLTKPFGSIIHAKLHGYEDEMKFTEILEGIRDPIHTIVEIGTCCGISSIFLAKYAEQVVTFDIQENFVKYDIWHHFGVLHKIDSYIVKDSNEIASILEKLDFDIAFIDGAHTKKAVEFDIQMTKKCGRLIFHDYDTYCRRGVMSTVHEHLIAVGGRFLAVPPFAYWERALP